MFDSKCYILERGSIRIPIDAHQFRLQLAERLERWAGRALLRIIPGAGADPVELTGRQILDQSRQLASRFTSQASEGSVVLLLFPHSVELFLLHLGLILEGRLPAILAWPTSRVNAEKYQRNLLHQLRNLPASQLVTLPRLAANLGPGLPYPAASCTIPDAESHERHFAARLQIDETPPPASGQQLAGAPGPALFLQFSGGTTGAQKCVVVTAPMLEAQMRRLREALDFTDADGVVSWLPLYHDMGLIACLWFPLWHGAPSTQMAASDWLLDPGRLLVDLHRYRATVCWLPNFAFSYMAGARERMKSHADLAHVRGFVNCSEPVRLQSMHAFAAAFADWGVRATQCQASYAMAETVFAVTQTPLASEPRIFPRARVRGVFAPVSFDVVDDVFVSSGRILGGTEVEIRTTTGEPCAEAVPGEIFLRSESQFDGYWGINGFTRYALTEDGWYATGDYGFLDGGELFVIGRLKDIVIVGGQNIFPEDIETLVNTADGVYPGRVVAFGVNDEANGTEALAVIAELRGDFEAARATAVEREIRRLVLATIGIAPRWVSVTPERWIVKSTAGKISRRETRQRFMQERLGAPK